MDEAAIEAKGLSPLKPARRDRSDRTARRSPGDRRHHPRRRRRAERDQLRHRASFRRLGRSGPRRIRGSALPAAGRPGHAGPRLLPATSAEMVELRKAYKAHVATMLGLMGVADAARGRPRSSTGDQDRQGPRDAGRVGRRDCRRCGPARSWRPRRRGSTGRRCSKPPASRARPRSSRGIRPRSPVSRRWSATRRLTPGRTT